MYADETERVIAEETQAALESEMITPEGQPVMGEPVDVAGGIETDTGQILPAGVNPVGGRPLNTQLGDALRGAGVQQPPPTGPVPGSGLPTPSGSQGAKYSAYAAYEAYGQEQGLPDPADFAVQEIMKAQEEANLSGMPVHITRHETGGINQSTQPLNREQTGKGWRTVGRVDPDERRGAGGGEKVAIGPDATPLEQQAREDLEYAEEDRAEREAIQADDTIPMGPPEAEIPFPDYDPDAPAAPQPAVEWADERLAQQEAHDGLDRLASEVIRGGGVTLVESKEIGVSYDHRTPSQNPPWAQSIIASEGASHDIIVNAVEKAKAGKRLGARQKRIVEAMLDEWEAPSLFDSPEEAAAATPEETAAARKRRDEPAPKASPQDEQLNKAEKLVETGLNESTQPRVSKILAELAIEELDDAQYIRFEMLNDELDVWMNENYDPPPAFTEESIAQAEGLPDEVLYRGERIKVTGISRIDGDMVVSGTKLDGTEVRFPLAYARPTLTPSPDFALEQEQDGVAPMPRSEAPQQHVDSDLGIVGDMFSENANKQVDLVEESRRLAKKEAEPKPARLALREQTPSELEDLVVEVETEIEGFIEEGETMGGLAQTSILAGIQKLKLHGHNRAGELMQIATEAFNMHGLTQSPLDAPVTVDDDLAATSTGTERFKLHGKETGKYYEFEVVWSPGSTRIYEVTKDKRGKEITGRGEARKRGEEIADEARGGAPRGPDDQTIEAFKTKVRAAYRANELAGKAWQRATKNQPQRDAERDAAVKVVLDLVPTIGKERTKEIVQDLHDEHIKTKGMGWGMPDGFKRELGFLDSKDLRDTAIGETFDTFFYSGTETYEVVAKDEKREIALVKRLDDMTDEDASGHGLWYMPYDAESPGGIMGTFLAEGDTKPASDPKLPHYSRDNYFTQKEAIAEFERRMIETDPDTEGFVIDEKKFAEMGPGTEERVFDTTVVKKGRRAIDTKLKNDEYITPAEADTLVQRWEDHAISQRTEGRGPGSANNHKNNFNRVIISLFDTTGTWANPYALAGYDVRVLDIKEGIDITDFSTEFMDEMFNNFEGKEIYGILAACPCTTFSNSSTKWRKDRHENTDPVESRHWIEKIWGIEAAEAVDENGNPLYASAHDYAIALVNKTMQTLEYLRPKFWALENPEGRIETSAGLPGPWRTGFQPNNFGDPYTKRTLLWGEFNEDLPTAHVDPVEGSKMHKMSPSKDRAAARSETPVGFSYAFFMANNFLDKSPLERTKVDYWYVAGAIEEAFRAGVTEQEIRDAIEPDADYEGGERESALEALRELIENSPGTPPTDFLPPTDTPPTAPGTPPHRLERRAVPREAPIESDVAEAAEATMTPNEARAEGKEASRRTAGFPSEENFRNVEAKAAELDTLVARIIKKYELESLEVDIDGAAAGIFVNDIAVPTGKQGKKRGTNAMRELMDFADKYDETIELDPSQDPETQAMVESFYKRLGFVANEELAGRLIRHPVALKAVPSETAIATAAGVADPEGASDAQKDAGNYKKGHLKIAGLDFTIENPIGSVRHGNLKLKDHYGYIKRTEGADGDNVDVFINSKAQEDFTGDVYVVDQLFPDVGGFDEHKVMFGYNNLIDARRAYRRNFNKDWKGAGAVTKMTLDEFKSWLAEPGANKTPAAHSKVTEAGRKERLAHGKKIKLSISKDLFNAPTDAWTEAVLGGGEKKMGDMPDTAPMNYAISELLKAEKFRLRQAVNPAANQPGPVMPASEAETVPSNEIVSLKDLQDNGRIGKIVAKFNQEFPLANIKLVNRSDPDIRAELEDKIKMTFGERINDLTVPGLYDPTTKSIYIFKDRLMGGMYQAMGMSIKKLILHEMVHRGLHVMFQHHKDGTVGELSYQKLMEDIYDRVPARHKPLLKTIELEYGLKVNEYIDDKWRAAEELVAHIAEQEGSNSMVARVVEFVRKFLERIGVIGPTETWSDQEIRTLIAESHASLMLNKEVQSRVSLRDATIVEEVTVEETGEVFEVERSANDAISDVDKRISICKKLRACL